KDTSLESQLHAASFEKFDYGFLMAEDKFLQYIDAPFDHLEQFLRPGTAPFLFAAALLLTTTLLRLTALRHMPHKAAQVLEKILFESGEFLCNGFLNHTL